MFNLARELYRVLRQKPKISKVGVIILGVLLVPLLVALAYGCSRLPDVGSCATPTADQSGHLTFREVDCAASDATYVLVHHSSGRNAADCPDGDYVRESNLSGKRNRTESKWCYALNVRVGDCLEPREFKGETFPVNVRVACSGGGERLKVAQVLDGKNDRTLCDYRKGENGKAYSQPVRTVCLRKM